MSLRLHTLPLESFANGPGRRLVFWFQGCTLACPGCFNPETHPKSPAILFSERQCLETLNQFDGEGITITGGEPLQQVKGLFTLLRCARSINKFSVILFTGYTLEEICTSKTLANILSFVDVLIAGRFEQDSPDHQPLLGSSNQRIIFLTNRIKPEMITETPDAEIIIDHTGMITISGVHIPMGKE